MFSLCSCVDTNYDLANKEISTDVEIKGNKLSFPLGSLKAFMIDSLVSGIELIDTTENGVYCIKRSDELYMEKQILPIELNIPSQNISIDIEKSSSTFAYGQVPSVNKHTIPFGIEKEISFENKTSKQFARIYSCSFKKDMSIMLSINLDGLEAIHATSADLDFTIDFPKFFKNLRSDDNDVKVEGNLVHITKEYLPQNEGDLIIKLYCSNFDFESDTESQKGLEPTTDEKGDTYLSHKSMVTANGEITLRNDDSGLSLGDKDTQMAMNMNFEFEDASVKVVNGIFSENFHRVDSVFAIDLKDLATTLEEANKNIRLAAPYLELILSNNINVPLKKVKLGMYGKDEEGELMSNTVIDTEFQLNQPYDDTSGEIIQSTTNLLLTSSKELHKEGFEKIETPNLAAWLEQIPDSVGYSVHPILNTQKRTNIRIDRMISLSAACKTVIPLSFEKLQLAFSTTTPISIEEDSLETFSNVGVKLKMTLANTIPLGLSLKTTALDENKNPIEDITINPIDIEPCNEEHSTLQTTKNKKSVEMGIKSERQNFADIKHLKFEIEVYTNDNNIVGFKPTQGIELSNIAIEISGDIIGNLNE